MLDPSTNCPSGTNGNSESNNNKPHLFTEVISLDSRYWLRQDVRYVIF